MAGVDISATPVSPRAVNNLISSFLFSPSEEKTKNGSSTSLSSSSSPDSKSPTQPRDKEAFLKRVSSFTIFKWPAKPEEVSPVVCARYGWENFDIDLLKCTSCKKILCGTLPYQSECETYKEALLRLCDSIISAHHKFCPWPMTPCPDFFIEIWTWSKDQIQKEFFERLQSLSGIEENVFEIEDPLSDHIKTVFDSLKTVFSNDVTFNFREVQLALRGWKKSTEISPTLFCDYCMRQAGIWNFQQSSQSTDKVAQTHINNDSNGDSEPPLKKSKSITCLAKKAFNPLSEHRLWCAWIKPVKVEPYEEMACWELHLQKLLKCSAVTEKKENVDRTPRITMPDHLQKIHSLRKTLANWSSPKTLKKEQTK